MDIKAYFLQSCMLLSCVLSMTQACMCRPNLKAEACKSDFVIVAKVREEREMMSQKGWVFHYSLSVSKVLKSSDAYEGAEKIMQTKLRGDGCGDQLKKGHTYIFAGHVGKFVDEGNVRMFLETEFCNYIDFKDLDLNKEVKEEINDLIQNPPACLERRADVERLGAFNDPYKSFDMFKMRRWNHPFQKKDSE
ncbi:uncharacterized protein LOC123538931 [Mercenaria mercenaria]|uniref:uncharacterized protein LOC123538931 n=1 Tax=Mercenaria mercenaria TaxID=6596 RepID=UPI00234F27D9|nr:uncharacterized protein LOC123538931 [Mercenaria mercenaria]